MIPSGKIPVHAKKVLVITSTNLSCNPRCLKEIRLLNKKGIAVTVLGFRLHNWTDATELSLQQELSDINFEYLDATRHHFFSWLIASVAERMARLLVTPLAYKPRYCGMVVGKQNWLLNRWVKKNTTKYDLVIAHNPPAFYSAYRISKKQQIPFALDIEDYHPGESNTETEKKAVAGLMRFLLPQTAYTSFAAPLILKESKKLLQQHACNKLMVINNSFFADEFPAMQDVAQQEGPLKLVWFSQFIDYKRGLENILPLLDSYADKISLTLIGNMRPGFYATEIQHRSYIRCKDAMPQKELHLHLQQYDAGLAIEDGSIDFNRNICLTNKIWAYLQAGLFIVASSTAAQEQFLAAHTAHGRICFFNRDLFDADFSAILNNKQQIRNNKHNRQQQARAYAWDADAALLWDTWQSILQ